MRLSTLLFFLLLSSCFGKEEPSSETKGTAASPPPAPLQAAPSHVARDADLLQIVRVSLQADQVMREAWWVVANERKNAPRSLFGKLQRAALYVMDGKLATKGIFSCDRYELKREGREFTFSEICVKGSPKRIARWTTQTALSAEVEFYPENLAEVVGLNASIFSKRLVCQLVWEAGGTLSRMKCPNWEQDRGDQLIRLTTMDFEKQGKSLLRLRGQVLKDLQPQRKIEADVPMEGKIVVTETEIQAPDASPEGAAPKPAPVRAGAPAEAQETYADPTAKAPAAGETPVNPDLIQRGVRAGSRAEPVPPAQAPQAPANPAAPQEDQEVPDEMQGMVPLLDPEGNPLLGPDGQPLWGRPSVHDGMIFVPQAPEENLDAAPEEGKNPQGPVKQSDPDFQQIPPGR